MSYPLTPSHQIIKMLHKYSTIDYLHIVGRRWTDNMGQTYHTAVLYLNGDCVAGIPISYGYGDQYITTVAEWMERVGLIKRVTYHGGPEPLHSYCKGNNIKFQFDVAMVGRKKDLHFMGQSFKATELVEGGIIYT